VRLAGSSGANPFACIAAGIASPLGPKPMAAPTRRSLKMLAEIGTKDRIPEFIAKRQGQEQPLPPDGLRPPRLQELRSPRDRFLQEAAHEVLEELGIKDDPMLEVAMELEKHRAATTRISSAASSTRTSTSIPASS
jgi:citrate synthase